MQYTYLLHHLVEASAGRAPNHVALTYGSEHVTYDELHQRIANFAAALMQHGLKRGERVAIYLDKRIETVVAMFGTTAAGGVFVPVNPILKGEQVRYILQDCGVRVLVTSPERLVALGDALDSCTELQYVLLTGERPGAASPGKTLHDWASWTATGAANPQSGHRIIDSDLAAILYTSGSTGKPKGVVLSHRNMVIGAKSVAGYLGNHADDTLLAALPLSFDAGFSQLSTAFHAGARVVLLNYLMPRDVLKALARERVTGLTAVPPLWIQLSQLQWPNEIAEHLRYIANTGGRMPLETLTQLRSQLPNTQPFLMYGLTEAFRATFLPPDQVDIRPDSIGKAIPNNEVLVLREDGTPCAPNEPGELVQRGPLVAQGYWNDAEKTAERFKPLPVTAPGREAGLMLPEIAVFSGDVVRMDEEGYLYFIGRRDEMMKTSGYRVSPTEVEEIVYATQCVGECAAFGIPHPVLGQAIVLVVTPPASRNEVDLASLQTQCRSRMPNYMVPSHFVTHPGPLPRNPNGKIDRKLLAEQYQSAALPDSAPAQIS
jgi:acyl-CoA ligase (AMP-forming) (exosortase A-associated)